MTKSRLHETDLCNICILSEPDQWVRLQGKRSFVPPHSLEMVRRNMAPLFGVSTPMFPESTIDDRKSMDTLQRAIKNPRDLTPNLLRAQAIIEFRKKYVESSISENFPSHSITIDNKVRLTHSFALEVDGKRVIPFVDLRKSGSLSAGARDFLFAMNFHLIIDAFSDFADFSLVVLDYWEDSLSSKGFTPHFFDGKPKYSYEQLSDMITKTHSIWLEILEGRKHGVDEAGPIGPLFA